MPNPRPQDRLDEAVHKLSFIYDAFSQPIAVNERFSLSDDGLIGLGLILWEIRTQVNQAGDELLSKLRAKEA